MLNTCWNLKTPTDQKCQLEFIYCTEEIHNLQAKPTSFLTAIFSKTHNAVFKFNINEIVLGFLRKVFEFLESPQVNISTIIKQ